MAQGVKEAQLKARAVADELEVELVELHRLQERALPPEWPAPPDLAVYGAGGGMRDLAKMGAELPDIAFSQTQRFVTTVELVYRTHAAESQ